MEKLYLNYQIIQTLFCFIDKLKTENLNRK